MSVVRCNVRAATGLPEGRDGLPDWQAIGRHASRRCQGGWFVAERGQNITPWRNRGGSVILSTGDARGLLCGVLDTPSDMARRSLGAMRWRTD